MLEVERTLIDGRIPGTSAFSQGVFATCFRCGRIMLLTNVIPVANVLVDVQTVDVGRLSTSNTCYAPNARRAMTGDVVCL